MIRLDNSTSDWIASANSTQLGTTDLYRSPVSPKGDVEGYVSLRVDLHPNENEFLDDDGWYK